MEYVLTMDRLSKRYGHFKALDDFSMHVPKGAIYGFVGKNGAGKTTLIRLVCGLQHPSGGSCTLYGIKHTDKNIIRSRRRMGAIVETPSIYLDMSARDNLKEQYRVLGLPSFDGIPELLAMVGLENTGRKKAKNFSLGMRLLQPKIRLGLYSRKIPHYNPHSDLKAVLYAVKIHPFLPGMGQAALGFYRDFITMGANGTIGHITYIGQLPFSHQTQPAFRFVQICTQRQGSLSL